MGGINSQMTNGKKILVTTALPYANGEIHIGHLLEQIQADIWARTQRWLGNDCHYLCADDTHGTPIMIRAREEGITPEQLVNKAYEEHKKDSKDFQIEHSLYYTTNSPENKSLCEEFYRKMKSGGHIEVRSIEQLYCPHDKMFLPDRFVKGTCPKCGSKEQNGDSCDVCGATYSTSEVREPHCYLCNTTPVKKASDHYFFKLNHFKEYLTKWLPKHTQPEVCAKMMEWFKEDLIDWDISRDEPYFGFQIPDAPGKYFYVWVDAPMGYISSTKKWCENTGRDFNTYWYSDAEINSASEVYHFLGKDITYFHTIFWPALLKSAQYRSPSQVYVHGFVTVNGEKMSKSKGTMIPARVYLNHLDPAFLRYYYASKLNAKVDDIDLNLEDFAQKVNSDLIGKITNLASRGAQMLGKKMDQTMSTPDADGLNLIKRFQSLGEEISKHFIQREYSKAITEIRSLADEANRYFDERAPWKTLETEPEETKQVLTSTLNLFRILAIYLTPVLPAYSKNVSELFNEKDYQLKDAHKILQNQKIDDYVHLASRVDPEKVKAMVEETKKINEELQKMRAKAKTKTQPTSVEINKKMEEKNQSETINDKISIDDFMKIDLRIAKIVEAEEVKDSDKLLKLKVDIGNNEYRQVFAGIKLAYKAEDLIGRLTVVVTNLAPRKMKFGESQGMVLAAGSGGNDLFILSPDSGAQIGQRVK